MKSLLRFALMLSLIVVGKLNQQSTIPAVITRTSEPVTIPTHQTSLFNNPAASQHQPALETGKFRSWRLVSAGPSTE